MTRRSLAAVLCAAALVLHPVVPLAQAIQRSMYVSVVDATGTPVADLGPADFLVREDNAPREVLRVAAADDRMQIAILVDNSQASQPYIRDIRVGLEQLVTDLTNGTTHELSIVTLGERPTILANLTSDRETLLKAVSRVFEQAGSANYLLNGIVEVCQGFAKRDAPRPVIVVITTEGPEYSSRRYEDVLKPLRETGTALHTIVLGAPSGDISEDGRNRAAVLDQGPRVSGGARESLLVSSALPAALARLSTQITHQYRVTYARPQSLIPPERVTVRAARKGLTARGTLAREPGQKRP